MQPKTLIHINLRLAATIILLPLICAQSPGQVSTGGQYSIDQDAIVNGGGQSTSKSAYAINSSFGQTPIGSSSGGAYYHRSGFWSDIFFAAAPNYSVGGRVIGPFGGRSVTGAVVSLVSVDGAEQRSMITRRDGLYLFTDVPSGKGYIVSVQSRRFQYDPASQFISLLDNISDLDFQAIQP